LTASASPEIRLPLWRAITGFGVLGGLLAVLLALAPVYLTNYRLTAKVRSTVAASAAETDDVLRTRLIAEAATFGVTALPGEIRISRDSQSLNVEVRYIVHRSLGLYQVDLHFHPSARVARQAGQK